MIRVEISEDAQADLNEGFVFYEAQGSGLGDYFIACFRTDIEGLKISAGAHRVIYADYHRLLSRVFPYGVFYTRESESPWCGPCSTSEETLNGYGSNYNNRIEPQHSAAGEPAIQIRAGG